MIGGSKQKDPKKYIITLEKTACDDSDFLFINKEFMQQDQTYINCDSFFGLHHSKTSSLFKKKLK